MISITNKSLDCFSVLSMSMSMFVIQFPWRICWTCVYCHRFIGNIEATDDMGPMGRSTSKHFLERSTSTASMKSGYKSVVTCSWKAVLPQSFTWLFPTKVKVISDVCDTDIDSGYWILNSWGHSLDIGSDHGLHLGGHWTFEPINIVHLSGNILVMFGGFGMGLTSNQPTLGRYRATLLLRSWELDKVTHRVLSIWCRTELVCSFMTF